MNETEKKAVEDAQAAYAAAQGGVKPQGITYHKVPSGVLAAVRQVLGTLPYDQVGKIIHAIETQSEPLEG